MEDGEGGVLKREGKRMETNVGNVRVEGNWDGGVGEPD